MSHPLDSCWAKIKRAKEHSDALDQYIEDTFAVETNRPRFGIKFDLNTGEHVLYVSYVPDLGDFFTRVSLILGDVAHNYRSALDHLTYQLAWKTTRGNIQHPRQVQFPIVDSPCKFVRAKDRYLTEVDPSYHAITERFQPYKRIAEGLSISVGRGGYSHSFALLRELDDADKHRLLNPVMIPPTAGLDFRTQDAFSIFMFSLQQSLCLQQSPQLVIKPTPIVLGTEIMRATLPGGLRIPDVEMAGYIPATIALSEGWPIQHVIERIAALYDQVIREFEPLL